MQNSGNEILFSVILTFVTFLAIIIFFVILLVIYQRNDRRRQKELFESVIQTEERERLRVARDLHDSLGAHLSAIKMKTGVLNDKISNTPAHELSSNIYQLLDDACKEVRAISHNMMPDILVSNGLVSALEQFTKLNASDTGVEINFDVISKENLQPLQSRDIMLYRVIQELCNNAVKSGHATRIDIQLMHNPKSLSIIVQDNGSGFDTENIKNSTGIGIRNIHSRIEYLTGKVNLESSPGGGTQAVIHIPIDPAN